MRIVRVVISGVTVHRLMYGSAVICEVTEHQLRDALRWPCWDVASRREAALRALGWDR
jgi:hypothetical protein